LDLLDSFAVINDNDEFAKEADGVRFLWNDDSDNQYFMYISHEGWYEVYYALCNEAGGVRP